MALGRRVADHMALALAHERLAEEARRVTQAQQQAARLQERVEELEGASSHRALGRSRKWKEVIAQAVHDLSRRRKEPFVPDNCGAVSPNLI